MEFAELINHKNLSLLYFSKQIKIDSVKSIAYTERPILKAYFFK